jgi:hypothetical protein
MKTVVTFVIIFSALLFTTPSPIHNKKVVGRLEIVRIYPGNLRLRARVDTGAKNSSLDAQNITEFERGGQRWIRFDVTNHKGKHVTLERIVYREVKIKRKHGSPRKRLVIKLAICLGTIFREVEVNLVDRSEFNYPMLIGRSFMENHLVVDPSVKFVTRPNCERMSSQ